MNSRVPVKCRGQHPDNHRDDRLTCDPVATRRHDDRRLFKNMLVSIKNRGMQDAFEKASNRDGRTGYAS